jgi:hypothetical protein
MRQETTPEDEERLEAEHLAWIAKAEAVLEHIVTTSLRPTDPGPGRRPRAELGRGALLRA